MTPESLFHAALAKTIPAERAAFLDEACGTDLDLRRQIDALLEAHHSRPNTLDDPAGLIHEATTADNPNRIDPYAEPAADTVVAGRYTLEQKLGEGGMGEVWIARQSEPVKRKVAVKFIKSGMDSRAVLARFDQERQALAIMDHPNIAKILDGGTAENGRPFFVMELVRGLPITTYCDQEKLTLRERLALFTPICQGVQHAHQKGIIHRDIKPSNILVGFYDGKPVPKIIDFGVAKATGQRISTKTIQTEIGSLLGTLEYMSPEQADLTNLDIDTRTDVYALGVILYELLTGTVPFTRSDLAQAGVVQMLMMIKEKEPQKPSTKVSSLKELPNIAAHRRSDPASLQHILEGELDWIIMKCLEKERTRRYDSPLSLAGDLERFLADEPVQAAPPSALYRFKKFVKRYRGQVVTASALLAALIALAVVSLTAAVMIWQEQKKTEKERIIAADNAEAAITVVKDLSTYVESVEILGNEMKVSDGERKKAMDATLASYQKLFALNPSDDLRLSMARMYRLRANLSRTLNETTDAANYYEKALVQCRALADAHPDSTFYGQYEAETSNDFGLLLSKIGQLKKASRLFDHSSHFYEELLKKKNNDDYQLRLGSMLVDRAEMEYQLGQFSDGEKTARTCMELFSRLQKDMLNDPESRNRILWSMAGNRLAICLREQDKIDNAITVHSEVVAKLKELVQVNRSFDSLHLYLRFRMERACTLSAVPSRRTEATDELVEAMTGWDELINKDPGRPMYRYYQGVAARHRGKLQALLGQRDAAAKSLNAAVTILSELTDKYQNIPVYRFDLGQTCVALGELATDPSEAAQSYQKAKEHLEKTVKQNPEHFLYGKALERLNTVMKTKP